MPSLKILHQETQPQLRYQDISCIKKGGGYLFLFYFIFNIYFYISRFASVCLDLVFFIFILLEAVELSYWEIRTAVC